MGLAYILSSTLLMSLFPIFFKQLTVVTDALVGTLALFASSFVLALLIVFARKTSLTITKNNFLWINLVALSAFVGNIAYFLALEKLEPAITSTVQRTELIFVSILGALFLNEKITKGVVVAIVFSFLGIYILQDAEFKYSEGILVPLLYSVLSALGFSLMLLFSKIAIRNLSVESLNFYRLMFLVLIIVLLLDVEQLLDLPLKGWFLATMCALTGPVGARTFLNYAISYMSMSKAMLFIMTAPLLTAIWQWIIWGNVLSTNEIFGGLLIITGLIIMVCWKTPNTSHQ